MNAHPVSKPNPHDLLAFEENMFNSFFNLFTTRAYWINVGHLPLEVLSNWDNILTSSWYQVFALRIHIDLPNVLPKITRYNSFLGFHLCRLG
ncbi:hypothetical protein JHK84_048022 [Glycine max]|uniref:Uncharacterized protein n=2 Tax=Glycine subgen. Soja TaxID=1462606 RepID=A0A0R0FF31_SOYBN|nr:hypothetical protein JHK86_047998 [Glycine max]KAG4933788.1 hypothetical protein JHK87_047790 [Glycine soja]KAG4943961.1 hypothetical protein JHK85_048607 [Glycine max]KAG5103053.1 hypothetical protein JHK84_048022 [Glycine max]KAH1119151.1 hypothetical protein GYH30_047801 [Glycine max]